MTLIRSLTLAAAFALAAFVTVTPATAGGRVNCDPCDRLERIERKLDSLTARRAHRPAPRAHKARVATRHQRVPVSNTPRYNDGCVNMEWTTRTRDGQWYPAKACVYDKYIKGVTLDACKHLTGSSRYPDINEQIFVDGRWVLYRTY